MPDNNYLDNKQFTKDVNEFLATRRKIWRQEILTEDTQSRVNRLMFLINKLEGETEVLGKLKAEYKFLHTRIAQGIEKIAYGCISKYGKCTHGYYEESDAAQQAVLYALGRPLDTFKPEKGGAFNWFTFAVLTSIKQQWRHGNRRAEGEKKYIEDRKHVNKEEYE